MRVGGRARGRPRARVRVRVRARVRLRVRGRGGASAHRLHDAEVAQLVDYQGLLEDGRRLRGVRG